MTTMIPRAAAQLVLLTTPSSASSASAAATRSLFTKTYYLHPLDHRHHHLLHHNYRFHSKTKSSSLTAFLFTVTTAAFASNCPLLIRALSVGIGVNIVGHNYYHHRRSVSSSSSSSTFITATTSGTSFGSYSQNNNSIRQTRLSSSFLDIIHNIRGGDSIGKRSSSLSSSLLFSLSQSSSSDATTSSSSSSFDSNTTTLFTTTAAEIMMDTVKKAAASKSAAEKLFQMRKKMVECNVDVYLIPSDDPHLSEYVPAAYMRRGYMTDFHGSAGTALVTAASTITNTDVVVNGGGDGSNMNDISSNTDGKVVSNNIDVVANEEGVDGGGEDVAAEAAAAAYLWTDSRYHNEASLRLDSRHWKLMKQGQPKVPSITKFLSDMATKHYRKYQRPLIVGLDAYVHSAAFAKELKEAFEEASKDVVGSVNDFSSSDTSRGDNTGPQPVVIGILDTLDGKPNIVDSIWENRPAIPKNPFRVQPMEYAGMTVVDKVAKVRSEMKDKKATLAVFSALDDVAYLFNLRCMNDVETCPVGIAYATISPDHVTLYCDDEKVKPSDVKKHLNAADVTTLPYERIVDDIRSHLVADARNKVWLDSSRSNYALSRVIPTSSHIDAQNPITPMKACKNDAEMEGMRRAHIEDGAAMAEFMAWLENTILIEGRAVSEVEIDEVLTACRAKRPGFLEVSFPTIAGVGSNGAIVHYRAAAESDLLQYLDKTKPILIDSGGQYEYGTTDVTRTWHFGDNPSDEFRNMYTRVLKGNIGVDTMIFPENTPGFVLDVFARKALWEVGKDYGHGTGHGVGAALNVHEGPHSISPRWGNKEVLKRGMVTSNEPGFYDDGNFGIRIENLLEIVDAASNVEDIEGSPPSKRQKKEAKSFLKFSHLTQIPIQKNLINLDLMTDVELDWLDRYHDEVFQKVAPLLEEGSPAMKWLVKSCEKITRIGAAASY